MTAKKRKRGELLTPPDGLTPKEENLWILAGLKVVRRLNEEAELVNPIPGIYLESLEGHIAFREQLLEEQT